MEIPKVKICLFYGKICITVFSGRFGAAHMIKENSICAVENFFSSVDMEFNTFLRERNVKEYEESVEMIKEAQNSGNRLHITGIGKPGHVAEYMASLFSSTGTPCYFLHGTEAVHGSCGQLVAGDVVIVISNSGETLEMKSMVEAVKNNGCRIIGVSAKRDSWLGKNSDAFLYAGVNKEGGPLNRAPRNSILAEILTLQALSVELQAECGQTPQEYVKRHPGGALGNLRKDEV